MPGKTLTVAVVLVVALTAAAQRLPHDAVPEHYQLTFTPHFEKTPFRETRLSISVFCEPGRRSL